MNDIKELAKWLKDEVEFLKANQDYVGGWYDLGNGLAATVLWEEGWGDEIRDDAIQATDNPDWALCAGVMIINKDDTPDGWFMPWDSKTGDLLCETTGITPNEDYEKLASWLLDDYDKLKAADIKPNGETIFGDPEREPEAPVETPVEEESLKEGRNKFIGKIATFNPIGFDEDAYEYEDYEEIMNHAGEDCKITYLSVDNGSDFEDCYWDIEFDDGFELEGVQGVSLELYESCNKECKKPIKEENEIHNSPYKDIIAEYFDYSGDFEFLDIVASCIGRVDNFEDDEDIYRAIDDELVYTYDQWKVIEHYCTPQEANWESAYSDFMNDVFAICSRIAGMNHKEDDDTEEQENKEEPEEGEED